MKENYSGVLIFSEQEDGEIHPVTYELLGKGKELAEKLEEDLLCVLAGNQLKEEDVNELFYYGAEKVFLFDNPIFEQLDTLTYSKNISGFVEEEKPSVVLFGATHFGRSLAPRVGVSLETGLTADCTGLEIDEEKELLQIRPAFSGNILAHIKTKTRPQMATVRYKVMEKGERDTSRNGEIVRKEPYFSEEDERLKIVEMEEKDTINIADSEIIVSGGRGLEKTEDFEIIAELAECLNGKVGSSRPLVDMGWIGKDHQVGFSGNTVKPRIYIACGISGQPQHLAGMRDSDIIIAINEDPEAPIFDFSDYGIVGDLYEVVPILCKKLKER